MTLMSCSLCRSGRRCRRCNLNAPVSDIYYYRRGLLAAASSPRDDDDDDDDQNDESDDPEDSRFTTTTVTMSSTATNRRQFTLRIHGDHGETVQGVLSWNGTDRELEAVLGGGAGGYHTDPHDDDAADPGRVLADLVNHPSLFDKREGDFHEGQRGGQEDSEDMEPDPVGASWFVTAVILIYGLSIIFLIASHVFIKKRAYYKDSEKQINSYLEQTAQLRDASKRESFKKLKTSLIPMIAQSPSGRDLIAKRVQYTPYLLQYVPFTATLGTVDERPPSAASSSLRCPAIIVEGDSHSSQSERSSGCVYVSSQDIVEALRRNSRRGQRTLSRPAPSWVDPGGRGVLSPRKSVGSVSVYGHEPSTYLLKPNGAHVHSTGMTRSSNGLEHNKRGGLSADNIQMLHSPPPQADSLNKSQSETLV